MGRVASRHYPTGTLERIQEAQLRMLAAFDAICRSEHLTYFLDAGTCLGAVRHGGFIPWDDDTDVGMPIDDYRRFLEVAPDMLPDGMRLATMENTEGFSALWAKVALEGTRFLDEGAIQASCRQELFLDVFPYIPMRGDEAAIRRRLHHMQAWQKVSYLRHMGSANVPEGTPHRLPLALACDVAHAILAPTTTDDFVRRHHEALLPTYETADVWANPCAARPFPFPAEVLFDPVECDFAGIRVFAPHDAGRYLELLYGDYMRLPPPEKRTTHTPVVLDFGDGVNAMATTRHGGW